MSVKKNIAVGGAFLTALATLTVGGIAAAYQLDKWATASALVTVVLGGALITTAACYRPGRSHRQDDSNRRCPRKEQSATEKTYRAWIVGDQTMVNNVQLLATMNGFYKPTSGVRHNDATVRLFDRAPLGGELESGDKVLICCDAQLPLKQQEWYKALVGNANHPNVMWNQCIVLLVDVPQSTVFAGLEERVESLGGSARLYTPDQERGQPGHLGHFELLDLIVGTATRE